MEYQEMNLENDPNSSLTIGISVDYKWVPQGKRYEAQICVTLPTEDGEDNELHHLLCGELKNPLFSRKWLSPSVSYYRNGRRNKAVRVFEGSITLTDNIVESELRVEKAITTIKSDLFELFQYNKEKLSEVPSPIETEILFN